MTDTPMAVGRPLLEASGLNLTGEDHLRVTSIGAFVGARLALEGRLVNLDGRITAFAEAHVPSGVYATVSTLHGLGEGFLTNAHLRVTAGAVLRGHVYATVEIVRGLTGAVQPLATLMQGYVSANARLAWPGSPLENTVAGVGRIRSITGTDPAAGVEVSETVPAGVRWRLLTFRGSLVTDGTVATRDVRLTIDDGALVVAQLPADQTQAASLTVSYSALAGGPLATPRNTGAVIPFPVGITLAAASRIRTVTANLQAGDNWGAPQYTVEEFLEG